LHGKILKVGTGQTAFNVTCESKHDKAASATGPRYS
jgi:hypothetical protein